MMTKSTIIKGFFLTTRGDKDMKTYKNIFEIVADDNAKQIFSAAELGLEKDRDYTEEEIIKALDKKGYQTKGIEIS